MTLLDDYLCIANAKEVHHQEYLAPYLMQGDEKKMILFGDNPNDVGEYFKKYPNTCVKYFYTQKEISDIFLADPEIRSKKMLLNSALNAWLINFHTSPEIYNIYVCHGVPQKLIGTIFYNWFWAFDTSIIHSRKDLIQILGMRDLDTSQIKDQKSIMIHFNDRQHQFVIAGNIRLQNYLLNKPSNQRIYQNYPHLDPNKKTLLYMPTYESSFWTQNKNLCTIELFLAHLIPHLKNIDDYNIIIKCHPNIRDDAKSIDLMNAAHQKHPNISYCFTGNYLHYMQIADCLITDFTSATYDFFYFDKPILYLDKFHDVKEKIKVDDYNHPYWLFPSGHIINPDNITQFINIIDDALKNDPFKDTRKIYKEISFNDHLSAAQVLDLCRQHKKYDTA